MIPATLPSPTVGVIELGPLTLHAYALCILAGIVAAIWICGRRLRDRGYDSEDALNVAWWAVPFGIVGGVPGKIIGQRNPDALHYSGKFKLPFF